MRYEHQLEEAQEIIAELRAMSEDHKPHEVAQKLHAIAHCSRHRAKRH